MFVPVGCQECELTGYRGRVGIYEILLFDETVRDAVRTGERSEDIRNHLRDTGMRLMQEDALDISPTGMFINTAADFPEGAILKVNFRLTKSIYPISVRCEVRYCLSGVGIGIEFMNMNPEDQKAIAKETRVPGPAFKLRAIPPAKKPAPPAARINPPAAQNAKLISSPTPSRLHDSSLPPCLKFCTIHFMPKPKKTKHPQTKLLLHNNSEIQVDHEIQELIEIMNAPGLATLNSCQNDRGTSYIQFRGKKSKPFMHSLLRQWLNEKRHRPEHPISFANPKNPKHLNSFQVRWHPSDYHLLLRFARRGFK